MFEVKFEENDQNSFNFQFKILKFLFLVQPLLHIESSSNATLCNLDFLSNNLAGSSFIINFDLYHIFKIIRYDIHVVKHCYEDDKFFCC